MYCFSSNLIVFIYRQYIFVEIRKTKYLYGVLSGVYVLRGSVILR